jgi:hypothetical protein
MSPKIHWDKGNKILQVQSIFLGQEEGQLLFLTSLLCTFPHLLNIYITIFRNQPLETHNIVSGVYGLDILFSLHFELC